MGDVSKEDIDKLQRQLDLLKKELFILRGDILSLNNLFLTQQSNPTIKADKPFNKAEGHEIKINNMLFKPLNAKILGISTGNGGVPADRQADRQMIIEEEIPKKDSLKEASKLLESLDDLRKQVRLKFKQLTEQEFLVFSAIYRIEEETGSCDYRTLALQLGLTESSIRDYVVKLIRKGIPIEKNKLNNKSIVLSISKNLKIISTLPTIFQLRNL